MHPVAHAYAFTAAMIVLPAALLLSDVDTKFHNAPASAQMAKNPYAGQQDAAQAGKELYTRDCLSCHGQQGCALPATERVSRPITIAQTFALFVYVLVAVVFAASQKSQRGETSQLRISLSYESAIT